MSTPRLHLLAEARALISQMMGSLDSSLFTDSGESIVGRAQEWLDRYERRVSAHLLGAQESPFDREPIAPGDGHYYDEHERACSIGEHVQEGGRLPQHCEHMSYSSLCPQCSDLK